MGRADQNNKGRGRSKQEKNGTKKPVKKTFYKDPNAPKKKVKGDTLPTFSENVRLNKFLANAGICSRREADVLIQTGVVEINGEIITEMGYKVKPTDEVRYDGQLISQQTKRYVLLNKPKDFVVSNTDAWGRKSVMQIIAKACKEPIVPVDRLQKETTGLLLFTNDTDLIKKLNHPKDKTQKIFHVEVDKNINFDDMNTLMEGVELKDGGFVKADNIEWLKEGRSREVTIEIHSNKYRMVERMLEAVGYKVIKLDRVFYAGLTKKDLAKGTYRVLTEQEVGFLKM